MNRKQTIKNLVSQFEKEINTLTDDKLEALESGKLEISLTQAVGHEAGGVLSAAASAKPTSTRSASAALAQTATSTVSTGAPRLKH